MGHFSPHPQSRSDRNFIVPLPKVLIDPFHLAWGHFCDAVAAAWYSAYFCCSEFSSNFLAQYNHVRMTCAAFWGFVWSTSVLNPLQQNNQLLPWMPTVCASSSKSLPPHWRSWVSHHQLPSNWHQPFVRFHQMMQLHEFWYETVWHSFSCQACINHGAAWVASILLEEEAAQGTHIQWDCCI